MKKIIYSFLSLFAFAMLLSSCNKDTQAIPEPKAGAMVLLESVSSPLFNALDLSNAKYSGTLRDPRGNVASFDIYARITRNSTTYSDLKFVKTITNVNGTFDITAQEVAAAVGSVVDTAGRAATPATADVTTTLTNATDLQPGDKIDFINRVKDKDGTEYQLSDISANLNGNVGQRSAFDFTAFVACGITAAFTGKYTMKVEGTTTFFAGRFVDGEEVEFVSTDDITRAFNGFTLFGFTDRTIDIKLLCGKTVVLSQSPQLGCGANPVLMYNNPDVDGSYNEADDTTFTIEMVVGGPGCVSEQKGKLTFTKK